MKQSIRHKVWRIHWYSYPKTY